MKIAVSVALAAMVWAGSAAAAPQTLGFDDISGTPMVNYYANPFVAVFSNYGGLTWAPTWAAVDSYNECSSFACGFKNGLTSGGFIAANGFNESGAITSPTPFRMISIQLGSAWYTPLDIAIVGKLGGTTVWSTSFAVAASAPTFATFPTTLVDRLEVKPTLRGTSVHTYPVGSGPRMVWDDFTFDAAPSVAAVPEPSAWAMLLAGFGLIGVIRRRQPVVAC